MTSGATKQRTPRCPRCGYDQSGLAATWTSSCPLAATCTECGYEFDPGDAFNPTRRRLPWLCEHAKRRWLALATLRTLATLLWPPAFWKRVRPEHPVRARRLVALPLAIFCVMPLLVIILRFGESVAVMRTNYWGGGRGAPQPWSDAVTSGWRAFVDEARAGGLTNIIPDFVPIGPALAYMMFVWLPVSAAFLALPSAWWGTRLRGSHLLRIIAYALTPVIVIYILLSLGSICVQGYATTYYLSAAGQRGWPHPRDIPTFRTLMRLTVGALFFVWPALYWLAALGTGYRLPRARATWGILMGVHLVPIAFFLIYWAFTDNAFR